MYITICDVPSKFADELTAMGAEIKRSYDGLMDVQFTSDKFRLLIRDGYIKIRNRETHIGIALCDNEFSSIHIN